MQAREHTVSMIRWWREVGVDRADLAVRRPDATMIWHEDVMLDDLALPWARAENRNQGEVFIRPARGYEWPLVMLDDVAEAMALRTSEKYQALVVKTSREGGCHVWLACTVGLDERARHLAQSWLARRAGADLGSTSGEHLGRLAGFKNWKRGGTWVNVLRVSSHQRRWIPTGETGLASAAPRPKSDSSPSGFEWGWVCGLLEAGLPSDEVYRRLVERARSRRGNDVERYACRTIGRAIEHTQSPVTP